MVLPYNYLGPYGHITSELEPILSSFYSFREAYHLRRIKKKMQETIVKNSTRRKPY